MRQQLRGKLVAVAAAEEPRKRVERVALGRQRMGLFVRNHLQPMLEATQKGVRLRKRVARRGIDPAARCERRKCGNRLAPAQLAVAAAGNQLLGLGKELDLANAAAAELDVVPLDGDVAVAAIGVNL